MTDSTKENISMSEYRTQIGFTNLIADCHRLAKRCDIHHVELSLKMVADTIAQIGYDYDEILKRKNKE